MQRRVAHNGESAQCTNIQESPVTPGKKVSRKAPPVTVSPTASPSVRTLILGIDRTGQIVQHDRTAPKILARSGDDLIGVHLTDITATASKDGGRPVSPDKAAILAVASMLEAIKSDREANDMLSIALADGTVASTVVTARPMQAGGSDAALEYFEPQFFAQRTNFHDQPAREPRPDTIIKILKVCWRSVAGDDDLPTRVDQRIDCGPAEFMLH